MSNPWIEAMEGRLSLADAVSLSEDPGFARRAWARLGKWQLLRILDAIPWLRLAAVDAIVQAGVAPFITLWDRDRLRPSHLSLGEAARKLHAAFGGDPVANVDVHRLYEAYELFRDADVVWMPNPEPWILIGWGIEALDQFNGTIDESLGCAVHALFARNEAARSIVARLERLPTLLEVMSVA